MGTYYDKAGTPIDSERWAELKNDHSYVVIGQETLPRGYRVSTVWLGIDHGLNYGHGLRIFETMVFPEDGLNDLDMDRYATEAEAKVGHAAMVKRWLALILATPGNVEVIRPDE